MPLKIIQGDITMIKCDAIVNTTNEQLNSNNSVCRSIFESAGDQLEQECRRIGHCNLSSCVLTKGYDLPCDYVIHTVAPYFNQEDANHLLAKCYKTAMHMALAKGMKSISFPLIGAGANLFPVETALKVAINRIVVELKHKSNDILVYLLVHDDTTYEIAKEIEKKYLPKEFLVEETESCKKQKGKSIKNNFKPLKRGTIRRIPNEQCGVNESIAKEEQTNKKTSDTLYIYKTQTRCHQKGHKLIYSTAELYSFHDKPVTLNVQLCSQCGLLFMNYTTYKMYREKYGALIGNIKIEAQKNDIKQQMHYAEESTLMLCGYSVSQKEGYSKEERQYIISKIIDKGIMAKREVIKYLEHFINTNGQKESNHFAKIKWQEDLYFTNNYNSESQRKSIVRKIEKY